MRTMPKHAKPDAPAAPTPAPASRAPRAVLVAFSAACAIVVLLPLVGMIWAPTMTTTENRELAEAPALLEDGALNVSYLSDWGDYFEDHFAYRNELVSLNALLHARLLGTSSAESVVVGTDGWLYYAGTLSDYCEWELLSDRAIDNIAFNLSLMQGYVQAQGATFTVTVAPNKNSLYPEHMPYYYVQGSARNLDALAEALEARGVNYVDLYGAFEQADEVLYYERDSHWNTKGALLATVRILQAAGKDVSALEGLEGSLVGGYVGDLNEMLYPVGAVPEGDYSYAASLSWEFVEGDSVEDAWVETSGAGVGSALVFRDSFGNNMAQFVAASYETVYFSKYVPYDLTQVASLGVDDVVVERAERHLDDWGIDPALMPAPSVALGEVALDAEASGAVGVEADGGYDVVSGDVPAAWCDEDVEIYVGVQTGGEVTWYVPFRVSTDEGDFGYKAYISAEAVDAADAVWVAVTIDGETTCVDAWER